MKPEGEGWIATREAARILGMTIHSVSRLRKEGYLTTTAECQRPYYYRIEAVEALARQPERVRKRERKADTETRRRWLNEALAGCEENGPGWEERAGLIRSKDAAEILGVHVGNLYPLARSGKLAIYQRYPGAAGDPFWFCVPRLRNVWRRGRRKPACPGWNRKSFGIRAIFSGNG